MATVIGSRCPSANRRVRAGLAGLALMVVATVVPACGAFYETSPPEGFGFTHVGPPRSGCYVSAVLPDPVEAVDRLVEYYHSKTFGEWQSPPFYSTGKCSMSSMPPRGKRPNAYGWAGSNDPLIGEQTYIRLWVRPLHPQGPAKIHLVISFGSDNFL
jgi:hypothetical protein